MADEDYNGKAIFEAWVPPQSVYAHWWYTLRDGETGDGSCGDLSSDPDQIINVSLINTESGRDALKWLLKPITGSLPPEWSPLLDQIECDIPRRFPAYPLSMEGVYPPQFVPIPAFAVNCAFNYGCPWNPPTDDIPEIDRDSVIVGVIDTGIGLGNSRFRNADGTTRILAAWQQAGVRPPGACGQPGCAPEPAGDVECGAPDKARQNYLPCGTELYEADINALLAEHSGEDLAGLLDETSFNAAAGLVDFRNRYGHRELGGRTAHGTHVLDLAAGFDPQDTALGVEELRRKIRIIAVNLPHRDTYGLSGTFLDFFALLAIKRIADLADLIWIKTITEKGLPEEPLAVFGFPIVINLSFGKNAGPKDGTAFFNRTFAELNQSRKARCWAPISLSIPVGNDNLEQGAARIRIEPGEAHDYAFGWRTRPEDLSSNFLEIWSETRTCSDTCAPPDLETLLAISVAPPGGEPGEPEVIGHGQTVPFPADAEPKPFARLYSLFETIVPSQGPSTGSPTGSTPATTGPATTAAPGPKTAAASEPKPVQKSGPEPVPAPSPNPTPPPVPGTYRQCFVLCGAATLRHEPPRTTAPSGTWRIRVRNVSDTAMTVHLNVQTDQSTLPYAATGLRSIFEDPDYLRRSEDGRLRDSFAYPYEEGADPQDLSDLTRRLGTLNDTASSEGGLVASGGYRLSDGRPALYSATGLGTARGTESQTERSVAAGRSQPTVALPTDDGPAHLGRKASGATSGSTVALQGTSFAAAAVTRQLAEHFCAAPPGQQFDPNVYLRGIAPALDQAAYPETPAAPLKVGGGRLPATDRPRVSRLGR